MQPHQGCEITDRRRYWPSQGVLVFFVLVDNWNHVHQENRWENWKTNKINWGDFLETYQRTTRSNLRAFQSPKVWAPLNCFCLWCRRRKRGWENAVPGSWTRMVKWTYWRIIPSNSSIAESRQGWIRSEHCRLPLKKKGERRLRITICAGSSSQKQTSNYLLMRRRVADVSIPICDGIIPASLLSPAIVTHRRILGSQID